DRILSHLAVLKLKGNMKAPILLLLGPPGVGKTSLGKSVAEALGRKYVRMSLGGLHDESEIRGHRKTYIGAMPGRIVQSLKKVQSANPVFILDEIDKVGQSHRGDPSSALLEVLDPEQNSTFHDNYLDLDIDLSKVMFIATANNFGSIQPALRDRMEIINLSGYSAEEKLEIAKRHLVPRQRKEHGLKSKQVKIPVATLKATIGGYTRESGVRSLNRQVGALMRYAAKQIAMEGAETVTVSTDLLEDILGPVRFEREPYRAGKLPGIAVGLAWTQVGGEILYVEASLSPGKGGLEQTGNLGQVMKESAITARSFLKANAASFGIDAEAIREQDLHIHVPEGATPKDGPSAGITMLSAMASAYTGRPIKPYLAMSGEITLRGRVLPVGGIKEKLLAARRAGMKTIMLSQMNEKNVREIEERYLKGLSIHYVETMREVLEFALG
ncbi:MAG: endopeptidase La, partial [Bacteroidota bacterium]